MENYGRVEVNIFPVLDTVATVDVLRASYNDVNFVETQKIIVNFV